MLRPLRAPSARYTISQAARLSGLTPRAVRLYEARGLITTERGAHGIRHYRDDTVAALIQIAAARRAGLPLADIRELLEIGSAQGEAARARRLAELCKANLAELAVRRQALKELAASAVEVCEPRRAGWSR